MKNNDGELGGESTATIEVYEAVLPPVIDVSNYHLRGRYTNKVISLNATASSLTGDEFTVQVKWLKPLDGHVDMLNGTCLDGQATCVATGNTLSQLQQIIESINYTATAPVADDINITVYAGGLDSSIASSKVVLMTLTNPREPNRILLPQGPLKVAEDEELVVPDIVIKTYSHQYRYTLNISCWHCQFKMRFNPDTVVISKNRSFVQMYSEEVFCV
jgi:hypothetical protein